MKERETKGDVETNKRMSHGGTSSTTTTTTTDEDISRAIRQSLYISDDNRQRRTTSSSSSAITKSADGGTILQPIYIPTASGNDTWELTWPIWHLLPAHERKDIALKNGFRTIGDFEEEVILSRALNEEDRNGNEISSYKTTQQGSTVMRQQNGRSRDTSSDRKQEEEEDDDDDADDDDSVVATSDNNQIVEDAVDSEEKDKNVKAGGYILLLPDELVLYHIFPYLSTEYFAACALVSPHWKGFTRSELAYKELCKRSYLNQSKRKALHVARFGGSYRTMLEKRFRVKTGCGLYILKCTKIKKIQRDMWTEIPIGAILESTYYRYLTFYEDGKVLYSLTSKPPHEAIPIFVKIQAGHPTTHSTVFGHYEIQKDMVTVKIQHPWHHVKLVLRILENGAPGAAEGRFWALQFVKHQSSASNNFDEYWSRDLVEYEVPPNPFLFVRNWKL